MYPILLLEINEVPWRLIDRYVSRPDLWAIETFFRKSHQWTTLTIDSGELSPWVTWPSLHRGMSNDEHGIANLGQDPRTFRGVPVWEEIRRRGGSIGICGSLQSWPPVDPGRNGFYIPDTFAHDARCIPEYISPIQALNLSQVRKSGRVVSRSMPTLSEALHAAQALRKSGIRIGTAARIATQLVTERFNRSAIARRPIFQADLFWDVFRRHFDPDDPPMFSTFFTNHIAGVMHRYWCDVFPEDFPTRPHAKSSNQEPLMVFALRRLNTILREAMRWAERNPRLLVVFATSMGQAAVERPNFEGKELLVSDLAKLLSAAGVPADSYRPLLAMVPQVAVELRDDAQRARLKTTLEDVATADGRRFVSVQEIGASLSITVHTPALASLASGIVLIAGRKRSLDECGLELKEVDVGTAYHVPQGALALYSPRTPKRDQRRAEVSVRYVKNWLLALNSDGPVAADLLAAKVSAPTALAEPIRSVW